MTMNTTNGHNGASFDRSRHGHEKRTTSHSQSAVPIAVVGMACRFAGGVTNPEELWELCASGRDAWSPIPDSRFDTKSFYDANSARSGRNHATGGYFLQEDVALFDAAFFKFTTEVASAMDPQLRLLLEVTYEATEDAGLPIEKLAGPTPNTSVFVGCYTKDYHDIQTRDPETMPSSTLTGNYTAMFSNRVSHFYDFQGASMSIDTGCSAALAALHQACQTIRSGESEVSIVGASNTILNPDIYIAMSTLGMVGADGRCYAWDSRAQGYGRGEGVAVLVLKSLDAAVRDGDRVHAVIRETGLNQDGKTTSITSPSMDAQIRLIRRCYQRAGLDISDTGYVEAHMTGTQAGDVTEAESLARTFGASRTADDPVWVGSVKTNVGHTEGVSGLAGIIKTAMAMKYRAIPPNQNYIVGNDKIPLGDWQLRVPTSMVPWPRNKPLRASINNFGYGGTNAHVIIEGAPETRLANGNGRRNGDAATIADENDVSRLYVLSAQDAATPKAMARDLAAHIRKSIEDETDLQPADVAFTLSHRRSRLSYITTVRACNLAELADNLEKTAALKIGHTPANKRALRLGFVFNGQGAQWHAMGRELLYAYSVFAEAIDKADRILRRYGADWSLREELMRDAKSSRVSEIHLGQPITVALQVCLVVLLHSWGIYPSAVTSHSSGEIAAAYAAGALSFEQALGVTYWRGELARTLLDPKASGVIGGMAAGGVGLDEAEKYVTNTTSGGRVVVACVNSPESVTLSGDVDDLDEVVRRLEADGKFARKLRVALAYHSPHMLHMASAYMEKLRDIVPSQPTWPGDITYTSPVTGAVVTSAKSLSPEHYVRNLTSTVLFSQAFEAMCFGETDANSAQVDAIIEIGPHGALAGPMRQILRGRKMPYMSCLQRNANAVETMQDVAGELVRLGYPVSLSVINKFPGANSEVDTTSSMKFVPGLPTYPWNHASRYWVESRVNKDIRHKRFPPHELLGMPVSGTTTPAWRNFIRLVDLPWIGDHRVDGMVVLPGAAYVSMAIEAVRLVTDPSEGKIHGYRVKDVEFLSALVVPESDSSVGGVETYFRLGPSREGSKGGWYDYEVRSLGANDVWVENCRGLVSAVVDHQEFEDTVVPNVESFLERPGSKVRRVAGSVLRADVASMGIQYGPAFQGIADVLASKTLKRAAAALDILELESPSASPYFASYVIHPTTLDCIIQATYTNLPQDTGKTSMVLPRSLQHAFIPRSLSRGGSERLTVFSKLRSAQRRGFTSDVSVANSQQGESLHEAPLLVIDRLFCQAIPRESESGPVIPLYHSRWVPALKYGSIPSYIEESMRITLADEELDYEKKVVRASFYLIADAAAELQGQPSDSWTAHQHTSFAWMKAVVARGKIGQLMPGSKAWGRASKGLKQKLFDELRSTGGTHGNLIVRIGQKLAQIVRGEITPTTLLGEDNGDLMMQYNSGVPSLQNRSYKHLAKIANLLAIQQPGTTVLEVGAGDGAAARVLLEAFGHEGNSGLLIDQYIFSDVSSVHFEVAKQKLATWTKVLEFRELELEKEWSTETSPDIAEESIDLVVASMNLRAANDPTTALRNVRRLLKPDGKLLLVEKTHVSLDAQLILSTLPGWEQQGEQPEFALGLDAWDEILRANGFTGVEFDIADCEQPQFQRSTVMLTSVAHEQEESTVNPNPSSPSVVAIVHAESALLPSQQKWLLQLGEAIHATTGIPTTVESLEDIQVDENQVHIIATDLAKNDCVLDNLEESTFYKLRRVLLESRGVLWLSTGAGADTIATPASSQVQGLLRTLRHENVDRSYVLLDLPTTWAKEVDMSIKHVTRVFQQTLLNKEFDHPNADWEYAIKDSVVHVPRVYPTMGTKDESETKAFRPFQDPNRPLVWEASHSGEGDFIEQLCGATHELAEGIVEIETRAFSLDPRVHHGNAIDADDEESTTVYEIAGIVTRLGPNTDASGFRLGDEVCGVTKGPYASIAQTSWTSVAKVPTGLSLEDAACVPLAYSGAYYALVHVAKLKRGDKVLVVQASGEADGTAGLALADYVGADVWFAATDLTETETQRLVDTYHIAPSRILKSRSARELGDTIKEQTGGQGVDVVLTGPSFSLSAPLLQSALDSVAHFGRFVEIGAWNKSLDVSQLAARCATYARVDLIQLSDHNGLLMKEILDASLSIISHSVASPSSWSLSPLISVTRFSPSQMSQAVRHLQQQRQRRKPGKIVIAAHDDSAVKAMHRMRQFRLDDKSATYLIVGGVDGIGGAIASWMVSKGARSVVLISRNAKTHPQAEELAEDAALRGCRLQVLNCDVSSGESLVRLLRQVSATSPPVRGVIHAANVLADAVFDRMSFAQWRQTVEPKVAGARNLHKYLPRDMSFFVLLSSVIGVMGHISQANYAAANTFEDALASHRVALGLLAVSLALPAVSGVGMVASDEDARHRVEALGTESIHIDAVFRLIEDAIRHNTHLQHGKQSSQFHQSPSEAQRIVGLLPWSNLPAESGIRRDRRFGTLRLVETGSSGLTQSSEPTSLDPTALLVHALFNSSTDRGGGSAQEVKGTAQVTEALVARLAAIFNVDVASVDPEQGVSTLGVDSLVAVELRNWLALAGQAKLSIFEVLQSASLNQVAELIIKRSALVK